MSEEEPVSHDFLDKIKEKILEDEDVEDFYLVVSNEDGASSVSTYQPKKQLIADGLMANNVLEEG